jgi:ring-1,2-phenylacetyl-CoA epoxidase subunit PaaC
MCSTSCSSPSSLHSKDERLAAIAAKAIKEINYHLRHSTDWVLRLGDGTEESHQRIQESFNRLWEYTGDLFAQTDADQWIIANGIGPDLNELRPRWKQKVTEVLTEATLTVPQDAWMQKGSRTGTHTEHFGFLLAELQYMQRAMPGCEW